MMVPNHDLARRIIRAVMERLRFVCNTEHRKVLVSIDRLDLCKVGIIVWPSTYGSTTFAVLMHTVATSVCATVLAAPLLLRNLALVLWRRCILPPIVPPCRCVVALISTGDPSETTCC